MLRSVHEFWASGSTYDELHKRTRQNTNLWSRYVQDTSFKFKVEAYNHTIPQRRQKEIMESFAYMDLLGEITMKNPDIILTVFEECKHNILVQCSPRGTEDASTDVDKHGTTRHKHEGDGHFVEVFFGRLVRSLALLKSLLGSTVQFSR